MNDTILAWAHRWVIPALALEELRALFIADQSTPVTGGESEAAAQAAVRLEASQKGARLWRNNVGVATDQKTGRLVRFGLANDSAAVNRVIKSSDLIGLRPIQLPGGRVIGQFVAREIKAPGWKYRGTDRERAQLKFLELVNALGGDGQFTTGRGSL